MSLSGDLISQFVKITKDNNKTNSGTTVYGTTVEYNGSTYVKLDGSDLLTPVSTTAETKAGERVSVEIKNHTATITGNLSSPTVHKDSVTEIGNQITEFEIIVADKVDVDRVVAVEGQIDNILSDNVTIKETLTANQASIDSLEAKNVSITEKLTAAEADIESLNTTKLDAEIADIKYATIESLEATDLTVYNLQADYGQFKVLTTEKFTAAEADISKLQTDKLDASVAEIKYATIEKLNATTAEIDKLTADVADIDTLIFGSASGTTIQTSFANAVIAQLGNAQIKSAMIESVSAEKITAGDIITNNVRVMSEDGKLLISDETIQISDSSRVRVQIGKDAAGDYSINIWDTNGKLMFSEGGITDNAIKDAIIRNDMVSETANISASKLDISSLFTEINGSTETIKATKIYLDGESQTLDVAFTSMSSDVDGLSSTVSSQGTQISTIQGQITSKVWQQDIDSATGDLSTKYSALDQEVDKISATVASHTTTIANKADSSEVTEVADKVSAVETDLSGFKATVSNTYATKDSLTGYYTIEETKSAINQSAEDIELLVAAKYQTIDAMSGYSTTAQMQSAIDQSAQSITSSVSSTYATKNEVEDIEVGGRNLAVGTHNEWVDVTISTWSAQLWHSVGGLYDYIHPISDYGISAGDYITLSVDLNAINKRLAIRVDCYSTDQSSHSTNFGNYVEAGNTGRSSITLKTTDNFPIFYVYIGSDGTVDGNTTEQYKCLKVEKGNKATDWTPAPEDVDEDIDAAQNTADNATESIVEAQTIIQQLVDSIASLVQDGNGGSLIKQDSNGLYYFDISEIETNISNTAAALDDLEGIVLDANGQIDVLKSTAAALQARTEYVRSYVDENDRPCLELGEGDSSFKVYITNESIQFADGTEIPAYIDRKMLVIEKAMIKNELQFGDDEEEGVTGVWIWKRRSNGNFGISWRGVSS